MKNIVTASIHFSFKGQRHSPAITIELDKYLLSTGELPNLYPLIAKENHFDMYSYEYEMMQAEEIMFSNAQGLVAEFIDNGILDVAAFQNAWHESKVLKQVQAIALEQMDIEDLEQNPKLKQALLKAFSLGKDSQ